MIDLKRYSERCILYASHDLYMRITSQWRLLLRNALSMSGVITLINFLKPGLLTLSWLMEVMQRPWQWFPKLPHTTPEGLALTLKYWMIADFTGPLSITVMSSLSIWIFIFSSVTCKTRHIAEKGSKMTSERACFSISIQYYYLQDAERVFLSWSKSCTKKTQTPQSTSFLFGFAFTWIVLIFH